MIYWRMADVIEGFAGYCDHAYSNCLPWRTDSKSNFSDFVARNAMELYAFPLVAELNALLVIALGKRASQILQCVPRKLPQVIVWNRAQAATPGGDAGTCRLRRGRIQSS